MSNNLNELEMAKKRDHKIMITYETIRDRFKFCVNVKNRYKICEELQMGRADFAGSAHICIIQEFLGKSIRPA